LVPSTPILRVASTTSLACFVLKATFRAHGRSTSAHWRCTKRCSASSIPRRRPASATSPACSWSGRLCKGAQSFLERALAIQEKVLGPEHSTTATSLNNLARLLHDQGDLTRARSLYERALAIDEKVLGPEHPDANRVRCNLTRLLLARSQPTEALAPAQTTLAAHDKAPGRDHPWTKDSARVTADALDALDGPRRRRRCGSGMVSLRIPKPPETSSNPVLAGTFASARKSSRVRNGLVDSVDHW